MAAVEARVIEGRGTDEAAWRNARWMDEAEDVRLEDFLPEHARLVVVSPHPDDEILGCGGLIHDAVAAGRQVRVVTLTDGEQAYPADAAWGPSQLAPVRRAELDAAMTTLGAAANDVVHLGLGDGTLAQRHSAIVAQLAPLLTPRDVLLVTWSRDGHPDHEAAARATRELATRTGLPRLEYPIWGWHWASAATSPFGDGLLRYPLNNASRVRKAQALRCFATQTGESEPPPADPILPPDVLARFLRPFEIFLRT